MDGRIYKSSEHRYQAIKSATHEGFLYVCESKDAREAKKRGKEVVARKDWDIIKPIVMLQTSIGKYSIPFLGQKLLDTDDALLVEGNWWHDNYWGNCNCPKCANIYGVNMLGTTLMTVRGQLCIQKSLHRNG
jgi:predicted NAD-dependent protein-ADP-ribosyltransferase YbiA (DUF1768 family)